jgi:hypothetical protein
VGTGLLLRRGQGYSCIMGRATPIMEEGLLLFSDRFTPVVVQRATPVTRAGLLLQRGQSYSCSGARAAPVTGVGLLLFWGRFAPAVRKGYSFRGGRLLQ